MSTIHDEITSTEELQSLVHAYQEISVMKMGEIRDAVFSTRDFLDHVAMVFHTVRISYKHDIESLMKKKKKQIGSLSFSTRPTNGKILYVLLSANTKLHGDIIAKTASAFLDGITTEVTDIAVVGKLGKEFVDKHIQKTYTYFDLPDSNITTAILEPIVQHMLLYEDVHVFFGKFENVILQNPQQILITDPQEVTNSQTVDEELHFFFEPSLESILHFFETQIVSALFKQTVHENELSRYGSRITAMEQAITRVEKRLSRLQLIERQLHNRKEAKKQLGRFAGITLWQTKKHPTNKRLSQKMYSQYL